MKTLLMAVMTVVLFNRLLEHFRRRRTTDVETL